MLPDPSLSFQWLSFSCTSVGKVTIKNEPTLIKRPRVKPHECFFLTSTVFDNFKKITRQNLTYLLVLLPTTDNIRPLRSYWPKLEFEDCYWLARLSVTANARTAEMWMKVHSTKLHYPKMIVFNKNVRLSHIVSSFFNISLIFNTTAQVLLSLHAC